MEGKLHKILKTNSPLHSSIILFIDDNPDHCSLIETALTYCFPSGVSCTCQNTVEAALSWLNNSFQNEFVLPKLILLDLYLPTKEAGLDLIQQIKALGTPFIQIPIIVFSHSEAQSDIKAAYQLGVNAYQIKPLTTEDWQSCFQHIRDYWWQTVTLPSRISTTL